MTFLVITTKSLTTDIFHFSTFPTSPYIHHCKNTPSSLHIFVHQFVHHCTLKHALTIVLYYCSRLLGITIFLAFYSDKTSIIATLSSLSCSFSIDSSARSNSISPISCDVALLASF